MNLFGRLLAQPLGVYRVLGPLLVVLFFASSIGRDSTPSDGGTYYVGAYCWAGFLLALLATVAFTLVLAGRSVMGRRSAPE